MTETKKKNTENSKEKLFMRVLEMNWKSEKIEKTSVYNTRQKKRFTQSKKMYDCEVSPAIFCLDCTFRKVQSFMAPVCLSRHKSSVSPHHPFACVFKLFHCFFFIQSLHFWFQLQFGFFFYLFKCLHNFIRFLCCFCIIKLMIDGSPFFCLIELIACINCDCHIWIGVFCWHCIAFLF